MGVDGPAGRHRPATAAVGDHAGPEGTRRHGGSSMRRTDSWRATALTIAAAALIPVGATKKKDVPDPKIEETVASVANIIGNTIKVEGVGLIVGLDDTGSEPSASWYTKKL